MNELTGTCSGAATLAKSTMIWSPVPVKDFPADNACAVVDNFIKAATATEQLAILKNILEKEKEPLDQNIIKLIAHVFFHSEAKHPIKCYITRFITKRKHLQEAFIEVLTLEIASNIDKTNYNCRDLTYETHKDVVSKIAMCIENFPAGTISVKNVEVQLAKYLGNCLPLSYNALREITYDTEKEVIYSWIHLTLKLLLHVITKNQLSSDELQHYATIPLLMYRYNVQGEINRLLMDRDVPMDTKSVCGIVTIHLSLDSEGWLSYLNPPVSNAMKDEYVQLAMYSAIITTVPMHSLQQQVTVDGKPPAIAYILQQFMNIVESYSGDGVLILGVSRSLQRVSKGLYRLELTLGLSTADQLLGFVWAHLDYYMDSVRHLAAQILTSVVEYCASQGATGASASALDRVLTALSTLGVERRGYQAAVRGAALALGATRLLAAVAPLPALLGALRGPSAAATTSTLDTLLQMHCMEAEASVIHEEWVLPIFHFVQTNDLESEVLAVLDNLLAKAVKLDQKLVTYILAHVKLACKSPARDLKNILGLLSVARTCLADKLTPTTDGELWRGIISYDVLNEAVVDDRDEVRLQSLALVCGGRGRGRSRGEGQRQEGVILRYLHYNINEQDPHLRQRANAMIKKFVLRVFDEYRSAQRAGGGREGRSQPRGAGEGQLGFIESVRAQCYRGLQSGANSCRRASALQILQFIETQNCPQKTWKQEYVDKLLATLDDSYETNKALALDILLQVPEELIKNTNQSASVNLDDILSEACMLNPDKGVSAAYKLELLWRRLPDHILQGETCTAKEPALFTLLRKLLRLQIYKYRYDPLCAPLDQPPYGPLHCIVHLLDRMHPESINGDNEWRSKINLIISVCSNLIGEAAVVVNHAAPEGTMVFDVQYLDYGNNAGVQLEDGREVTAQMVLLCAWRTVKEACGVLGALGALCPAGALTHFELGELAKTLEWTVCHARHRGALEQAYAAFERVMHRMWRDEREYVRRKVACRLKGLVEKLLDGAAWGVVGADRRSAGLPFHIQGLVSTEVNAGGPGTGLQDVMTELLRRAEGGDQANSRAHACNMLRALYRANSLDKAIQSYVGEGLRVALKGFDGTTWVERNSATLLLSALMTRVFGVSRDRAGASARNRMTGRVFFLRYPRLYDIMLNTLKEVSENESKLLLCPSLYPVLLLLARLYPSSLEGTESNLKLDMFVPYVVGCARSRVLGTRRLAAAACLSLVPPLTLRYVAHLEHLMGLISEEGVEKNFCHGILLQLCAFLENKPASVECRKLSVPECLLELRVEPVPCYPVLQEQARFILLLILRFPESVSSGRVECITSQLRAMMSGEGPRAPACGRELCLAQCLRTLLVLLPSRELIAEVLVEALAHAVHEVRSAALRALLALHGRADSAAHAFAHETADVAACHATLQQCKQELLSCLRAQPEYLSRLAAPLRDLKLWTCDPQRMYQHLEVLVAEGDTQKLVISALHGVFFRLDVYSDCLLPALKRLATTGPEPTVHLYLESIISYVFGMEVCPYPDLLSDCLRTCCRNGPRARAAAARAWRLLMPRLLPALDPPNIGNYDLELNMFESISQLLQDEEPAVRREAAHAALSLSQSLSLAPQNVGVSVASHAAESLLSAAAARPRAAWLLTCMARAHEPFESSFHVPVPPNRRRRAAGLQVFEPRAMSNPYSESALWAEDCAARLQAVCRARALRPAVEAEPYVKQMLQRYPTCPILQLYVNKLNSEYE